MVNVPLGHDHSLDFEHVRGYPAGLFELQKDTVFTAFGGGVIIAPLVNAAGIVLLIRNNAGDERHYGITGKGVEIDNHRLLAGKAVELQQLLNVNGASPFEQSGGCSECGETGTKFV